MESQLSGKKVSIMLYTCHNCGGQLWKRRQIRTRKISQHFLVVRAGIEPATYADELLATAETPSSTETTQLPANNNKPNTTSSAPERRPRRCHQIRASSILPGWRSTTCNQRRDNSSRKLSSSSVNTATRPIHRVSDVLDAHILQIFSITNEAGKGKEGLLVMHNKLNGHLLELKAIGKNFDTAVSGFRMALKQLVPQLPKDIQSR
ncbi:hypothetical protein T01_11083 [Trichinella spiralis]|uniref:Uncharacterized protein n=1 Tax=Trichinella spiralis TaxID=6334 RepID=A0A0V1B097_TRISP|nr:hypothetical protein T01_11083 [Trichinella spiralis]